MSSSPTSTRCTGELQSRGTRTLDEPKDDPYGMRDFDVHDLDGNHLCGGMESRPQRA